MATLKKADAVFVLSRLKGAERSGEIEIPRSGASARCSKRKRGQFRRQNGPFQTAVETGRRFLWRSDFFGPISVRVQSRKGRQGVQQFQEKRSALRRHTNLEKDTVLPSKPPNPATNRVQNNPLDRPRKGIPER